MSSIDTDIRELYRRIQALEALTPPVDPALQILYDFLNVGDWLSVHTTGLVPPDNLYGQVFVADDGGFLFSTPDNFQADVAQAIFQVTGVFGVVGGGLVSAFHVGVSTIEIAGALPTVAGVSGSWWNDSGTVKIVP